MSTVKLTIDGTEVEVPKGTKVIEAAKKAGSDVPFYCYHPGLSIAGNCRMCLVEIEKMPKLGISCHTDCADGMVVHTQNERVKNTRKHILEFLLVNHPVDCPVCDQAGECWLQDYYMNYGAYQSRVNENKIKKKKAQPIGDHVMLDQERCILCSRCVRFTDEISKTNELGIVNRGDHSEIAVFPGTELENAYTGNVVDLCPVGALTDRDFRFKMRVWYLKSEDTICNGCSKGCNIQAHYRTDRLHHAKGERIIRQKPRYNGRINKWWMCDEGRYNYKQHDHNRITGPLIRKEDKVEEIRWNDVIPEVTSKMKQANGKFGVLLSPQLSNEAIYLAKKLFSEDLNAETILLVSPNEKGYEDDFLIKADKNPNSKGAELQGLKVDDAKLKTFFEDCGKGKYEGVVILGQDILSLHGTHLAENQLKGLQWSVYIGPNHNLTAESTSYVLPAATYFEKEGTFTNCDGITQKFNRVVDPLGEATPDWNIFAMIARQVGTHYHYEEAEDIFRELSEKVSAFSGMTYESLAPEQTNMDDMAMPLIPELEQDSGLIFYDPNPNQKQDILDAPKAEEIKS